MHHGEASVFAQLHTCTISAASIVTVKQLDVIYMTLHSYVHIPKDCAQPCWPFLGPPVWTVPCLSWNWGLKRKRSHPRSWFCYWWRSRLHTGTGNYQGCCDISDYIPRDGLDLYTRQCLWVIPTQRSAFISSEFKFKCCSMFSLHSRAKCLHTILNGGMVHSDYMMKLTIFTARPRPTWFAHTGEGGMAVLTALGTLLVAWKRRALVTDLWQTADSLDVNKNLDNDTSQLKLNPYEI